MNNLKIFVEGIDDERFFSKVVIPCLKDKYNNIKIIQYAKMKKEKIKSYVSVIKQMKESYIFAHDIDDFDKISSAKEKVLEIYDFIDEATVLIVIKEIESWYLAGLDKEASEKLGLKYIPNTNNLSKEVFNNILPSASKERVSVMIEMINLFNYDIAVYKNNSFKYFMNNIA